MDTSSEGMQFKNIVVIMAMELEAASIIGALRMHRLRNVFDPRLPLNAFQTKSPQQITLVLPGICPTHQVDRIGSTAATLCAWESIRLFEPDLVINAGTAGGFQHQGTAIGDVFISQNKIVYHHRHIPSETYYHYQVGNYKCLDATEIAKKLNIKCGIVSSGDSVIVNDYDEKQMLTNMANCKDMEAAAVAEVAQLCEIPMIALKCITDFVDSSEDTAEQFFKNYQLALQSLTEKLVALISILK